MTDAADLNAFQIPINEVLRIVDHTRMGDANTDWQAACDCVDDLVKAWFGKNAAAASEASALRVEVVALRSQLVAMNAKLLDANPEIARLRGLIKEGCKAGEDLAECPWCLYMHSAERNDRAAKLGTIGNYIHALDCPAFSDVGVVR